MFWLWSEVWNNVWFNKEFNANLIILVPYFNDKDRKAADEEVSMLKLAGSKYTVNYVESFTFDVDLCIVMEYCDGGNLREMILKTKTLTVKERKNVFS